MLDVSLTHRILQTTDGIGGYSRTCKKIVSELERCSPLAERPTKSMPGNPPCDPAIEDLTLYLEQWVAEFELLDSKEQAELQQHTSTDLSQLSKEVVKLKKPETRIAFNLKTLTGEKPPVNEKSQQLIDALTDETKTLEFKAIIKLFAELLFHSSEQYKKWLEQQFAYFIDEVIKEQKEKLRVFINKATIAPHYRKLKSAITNSDWDKKLKRQCFHLAEKLRNAVNLEDYFDFFKTAQTLPPKAQAAINSQADDFAPWLCGDNAVGLNYIPAAQSDDYAEVASRHHLQLMITTLQTHQNKLIQAKKPPLFTLKSWFDRLVYNVFRTSSTSDDYELVNTLLKQAQEALNDANQDMEEAQLITLIGTMKTKIIRNKQKMSLDEILSDGLIQDLEGLVTHAGHSFQNYYEIRRTLNELLKQDAATALNIYKKERLNKPLIIKNSISFRSWRLRIFDKFFPGGKFANKTSQGKTHDGLTHRQNSADRLMKYLSDCQDIESYYNYVGLCCYELSQIQDQHSALKNVIIRLLTKIISQKILPEASVSQKTFIYRMLVASLKNHPNAKALLEMVRQDLMKNNVPESLLDDIYKDTRTGVKIIELTHEAMQQTNQNNPPQDETICQTPALTRFHNTIFSTLNSRLLAYKIAPSGLFQLSSGSYTEIGSNLTSAISSVASATGLPFLSSANNIITNVFRDIDEDQRSEAYRNINKLFDTPEKCAQFSKFMAETLTRIWEYQVEKVGADNAKILAQCAVERMIDYLMQGYFIKDVPIETQLIAAVRSQRIGHGIENFRLSTDECTTILSRKAWLAHEVFENTSIYDPDSETYFYSPQSLPKFGAARDGTAVAELLNITRAEKPVDNVKYEKYQYQTTPPNYKLAVKALQSTPEKIMTKVKKLKQIVTEQQTHLQQRAITIQEQNQTISQQNQKIDQLSQQVNTLQQSFELALENQKLLQQQLKELQANVSQHQATAFAV